MSTRFGRLRWYVDRLRAMPPREILHRIGEAGTRLAWRRRPIGWPEPASAGQHPFPAFPHLQHGLAEAFEQPNPGLADSLSRAWDGAFRFLGRDWSPYRPGADDGFWLHDPIHGERWPGPETSSFGVGVRSTWPDDGSAPEHALGDVKYVWECNRLQLLHPLAVALAGGDPRAAPRALAILHDWCASNPPYGGVNWVSGIELALRLVGIALLCAAAGPEGFTPAERGFLRMVVTAHARHLAAFPSLHSSANNHRVAEGLGLLTAGLLMENDGSAWERDGGAILAVEARRQILPDGVGAEQSPTYQAFTMEMLGLGVLLSRDVGRPLAPAVSDRLEDGAAFLLALMNEAGDVPAIGDDDEGRVLAQPPDREPRYVASVVAAVAGLTARRDLLPPARDPHWRDALFAVSTLDAPTPPDAGRGLRVFRQGGYTVARETVAGRKLHLVFDHGPLGDRGLAAHGHADALGLWLDLDGTPILIDSGTFLYHSGRERRTGLRESLAHSTLCIAGRSQSVASPAFSWVSRAQCRLVADTTGPGWSVIGRHDGYRRRFGVLHERRLRRTADGFAIDDQLVGATALLPVEIRFILDPDLRLAVRGRSVVVLAGDEPMARLRAPEGFAVSVIEGDQAPLLSRRFGDLEAGRALVFSGPLGADWVSTVISVLPGRSHPAGRDPGFTGAP